VRNNGQTCRGHTDFIRSVAFAAVRDAGCPVSTTAVCRLVNQRYRHQLPRPLVTEEIYRAMVELHRRDVVPRVPNSAKPRVTYWEQIAAAPPPHSGQAGPL
jgi:hypothetical protein